MSIAHPFFVLPDPLLVRVFRRLMPKGWRLVEDKPLTMTQCCQAIFQAPPDLIRVRLESDKARIGLIHEEKTRKLKAVATEYLQHRGVAPKP